jgi:hypothetical protein
MEVGRDELQKGFGEVRLKYRNKKNLLENIHE